jgi:O-methyltransferase involved in polyketide biosynthesis
MDAGKRAGKKRTAMQPSAALVMIMAQSLYHEGIAARFMDELDLSSGTGLKEQCDSVCSWYGEVVLDRKYLIHHLVSAHIAASSRPCRVVIPAAGMSPLALQLCSTWNNEKLAEVIEFDLAGMHDKLKIYRHLVPEESGRLKCHSADIGSEGDLRRILPEPDSPLTTILVMEGITYYLRPETILHLLRHFSTPDTGNHAIIEYMQPCGDFSRERQDLPRKIFRRIMDSCGLEQVYPYHTAEIEEFVRLAGGTVTRQYSLTDMERIRTGKNRYFPRTEDGWKWVADARL